MSRLSAAKSRKIVLITAIGGLSLYLLMPLLHFQPQPASAAARPLDAPRNATSDAAETASRPLTLTPRQIEAWRSVASAGWPDDPFTPHERYASRDAAAQARGAESVESHAFVLNAVMRGEPPLAMINGRIVAVGDRIDGGAIVESISDYTVRIRIPDGVRMLRMID